MQLPYYRVNVLLTLCSLTILSSSAVVLHFRSSLEPTRLVHLCSSSLKGFLALPANITVNSKLIAMTTALAYYSAIMDKLKLTGRNLGRVFMSRLGRV